MTDCCPKNRCFHGFTTAIQVSPSISTECYRNVIGNHSIFRSDCSAIVVQKTAVFTASPRLCTDKGYEKVMQKTGVSDTIATQNRRRFPKKLTRGRPVFLLITHGIAPWPDLISDKGESKIFLHSGISVPCVPCVPCVPLIAGEKKNLAGGRAVFVFRSLIRHHGNP